MKISPLDHTATSFGLEVYKHLGKGRQHAIELYSQWMRDGRMNDMHKAFKNAAQLVEDIHGLIDMQQLPIVQQQQQESTVKALFRTTDGLDIETVLIPMRTGTTLCVSSQIGCRRGCAFCETGRMGLLRNLHVKEIVGQLFGVRHQLQLPVRNIVFMGMGEPFDNYDAVMAAVQIMTDPKGFGYGKRQITISTSGCIEGILRLMAEPGETPNLAVSITAADDQLRNRLMPINRKHDLQTLHNAMQAYCQQKNREILIAYVALKGVNDTLEHAKLLANYLRGLSVKINIIPYNAQKRDRFAPSDAATIDAFADCLRQAGYYTLLRRTRGRGIMAACGQLGNVEQRRLYLSRNSCSDDFAPRQ